MKCILLLSDDNKKRAESLSKLLFFLAGAVGFEPTTKVLETHVLPLHHAPWHVKEVYTIHPALSTARRRILHLPSGFLKLGCERRGTGLQRAPRPARPWRTCARGAIGRPERKADRDVPALPRRRRPLEPLPAGRAPRLVPPDDGTS